MASEHSATGSPASKSLVLAAIFGLIFGFLLQKSGVAKYHILIGVLLLQDFTVIKVMLSAIIVSMAGLFILNRMGKVELNIKPTRFGANILGGLVFGAGFALSGYCPGTGAAALGQMNWDALFMIAGMIAGSFIFAEMSGWIGKTIQRWGERGKLMLPEAVGIPKNPFVAGFIVLLVICLFALARFT